MCEYNLKGIHVSCLYYLYSFNPLTFGELCEKCEEDKAAVSRSIEHLKANGFITENRNSCGRYKTPIMLSEKGNEAGKKIADKISAVLKNVSSSLSDTQRADFYKMLSLISENLEKISTGENL